VCVAVTLELRARLRRSFFCFGGLAELFGRVGDFLVVVIWDIGIDIWNIMRESRPMAGRAMTMEIGERFGYHPFHSIFHHNFRIPYGLWNSVKNQQSVNIQTDSERSPCIGTIMKQHHFTYVTLFLCSTLSIYLGTNTNHTHFMQSWRKSKFIKKSDLMLTQHWKWI